MGEQIKAITGQLSNDIKNLKPKMRGWLHAGTIPLSLIAGMILIFFAPPQYRIATVIYVICTLVLFSISATYHRGNWSPRTKKILQRIDHSAIFLLIAGTYTPVAIMLTHGTAQTVMLMLAWVGATLGIMLRMLPKTPRWLFVPIYLALGLTATIFIPNILSNGGPTTLTLIIVGGVLYVLGAIVFATQYPNPSPKWFGFHEIFHSFTIGAWIAQYAAILLTVLSVGTVATN